MRGTGVCLLCPVMTRFSSPITTLNPAPRTHDALNPHHVHMRPLPSSLRFANVVTASFTSMVLESLSREKTFFFPRKQDHSWPNGEPGPHGWQDSQPFNPTFVSSPKLSMNPARHNPRSLPATLPAAHYLPAFQLFPSSFHQDPAGREKRQTAPCFTVAYVLVLSGVQAPHVNNVSLLTELRGSEGHVKSAAPSVVR
ncbi:hypothetical protein E2C01_040741 [Portunus trituberculatus]|uniref:Uncharacterized protein n=1 Tax=Portunus trituberculatus TaxID=210409 RepID=A0A5B7FNS5_PORTR|nr:hypothetical protein [Portunus trituberculatus]